MIGSIIVITCAVAGGLALIDLGWTIHKLRWRVERLEKNSSQVGHAHRHSHDDREV